MGSNSRTIGKAKAAWADPGPALLCLGDLMSRRSLELLSDIADYMRSDCEVRKLYALVESALSELVGFRLLTILRMEHAHVRRLHSSDPETYPAGGVKDISGDTWLREMLEGGKPVVSNTPELVQQRFPDHQAIFALGCGAVLNVPVTDARQTLGSTNLLHGAG
jgi:transcriptional regulator with GAF, ATPase, and Fis domain